MFAFAISSFPAQLNSKTHACISRRTPSVAAKPFLGSRLRPTPPACIAHSNPQFQTPKCYSDSPERDDDGEYDDEDEELAEIILTDPDTDRTLAAGVEHTVTGKGNTYILCYPIDDPVTFASSSDDGILDPVVDNDLLQSMFPNARAVLAEEHIVLRNSAFFLTIDDQSEDLAEGDEDDEDDEDDEEDEDQLEHSEMQPDEQDVEVIAEFLYDGRPHFVVRPVDAILVVAQVLDDGYRVLKEEELRAVSPIIEDFIENAVSPTP